MCLAEKVMIAFTIINVLAYRKVNTHVGRLLFLPNLQNKGVHVSFILCSLCRDEPETAENVLIHCVKVKPIWLKCFSWWGVQPHNCELSMKTIIEGPCEIVSQFRF